MRVVSFLLSVALPITALPDSLPATQAAMTDPQPWRVESGVYQCRLKQDMGKTEQVSFIATAGKSLELHLSTPWRNRALKEARLYQRPAPWKSGSEYLLETLRSDEGVELAVFDREAASLLGHMTTGGWGRLHLILGGSPEWQVDLSSVGMKDQLQKFNDCRNRLPTDTFENKKKTVVYFDSGSVRLSDQNMVALDELARYLLSDPTEILFRIDGHTDRTGRSLENLEISRQRASSVRDYLLGQGVLEKHLLTIRHHGLRYPLNLGRNAAERQMNRRVEIVLSKGNYSNE